MLTDPDRAMTYNAQNQMTKVVMTNGNVIDYDYDYTGARVSKKVTTDASTSATTYYLGNAIEIRDSSVLLSLFANNQKLIVKNMGTVDEILGAMGASFRNVGITPNIRFATVVPWLLLGFMFFVLASLRPIRARPVWAYGHVLPFVRGGMRRGRFLIPSPLVGEGVRRAGEGGIRWALNFYLCCRFKWSSYTHAISEAVQTFHLRPAFKIISVVLAFLIVLEYPLLQARAGDAGLAPGQASDEQYTYYVHGDHLGSAHLLTEGQSAGGKHVGLFYNQGDLIQRIEYNPYGQEMYVLNPNLSFDPSFTGQTYDIESGLYYFNARYYNPQLGRFIQADTVVPSATDFQSYNRYAYARNNPLKYVDPSGHSFWDTLGSFLGAYVGMVVFCALAIAIPGAFFLEAILCAAAAGAAGGLVSGAISGGMEGAMRGMATGMMLGALSGAITLGMSKFLGNGALNFAVMQGIGISLNASQDGWEGVLNFGASFLGAYCGGMTMGVNILDCLKKKPYVAQGGGKQFTLDIGAKENFGIDPSLGASLKPSPNQVAVGDSSNSLFSGVSIEGTAEIIGPPSFDWKYEIFGMDNLLRNLLIAGSIGATTGAIGGAIGGTAMCPGLGTVGGTILGGYVGAIIGFTGFAGGWILFQFQVGEWIYEPITMIAPWAHGGVEPVFPVNE